MKSKAHTEDQAFKLLAFLVTGARLCVDQPEDYGTFRLIDGACGLLSFLLESDEAQERDFYAKLRRDIEDNKLLLLTDEEAYAEFLPQKRVGYDR